MSVNQIDQRINDRIVAAQSSQGRVSIAERLSKFIDNPAITKKSSDAVTLRKMSELPAVATYNRSLSKGIHSANIDTTPIQNHEVDKVASIEQTPKSDSIFKVGGEFQGMYRSGKFITENNTRGTYEAMPGGQISFSIDGFQGILMTNNTAVAFNPETGESFKMKVRMNGTEFKAYDIQELSSDQFKAGDVKPIFVEGKNDNVHVRYSRNSGEIAVSFPDGHGGHLRGHGFMDNNGTMILALSNGSTIQAKYDLSEDGKLRIYSRQNIV